MAEMYRQQAKGVDREKLLARKKRYRENHLESEKERNRLWREANKEYVNGKNKEWRAAHPGYTQEGVKKWRAENPELAAAGDRALACNRRAKAADIPGHISRADITALWGRQPQCINCGQGRGVDHIIPFREGGPNTPDNLQNLCQTCNALKEAKLNSEQADEIRQRCANGESLVKLAQEYQVTKGTIWAIKANKLWKT